MIILTFAFGQTEFSGDARNKEESARLLGRLIRAADRLIKPYVAPMLQALTPKLKNSPPAVAACVLQTIGTRVLCCCSLSTEMYCLSVCV